MTFYLGSMLIHSAKKAQIASLLIKEVIVPVKYLDFANVFLKYVAAMLPDLFRFSNKIYNVVPGITQSLPTNI